MTTNNSSTLRTRLDVSAVPHQGAYIAKSCPVRAQNDVLQPCEPAAVDASLERRFERGRQFEADVFAELRQLHPEATFVTGHGVELEAATLQAMASNSMLVVEGRLPADEAGRRVGKPDILIRAMGGGWRAIDVKHHMTLSSRDPERPGLEATCSSLSTPAFEAATGDESVDRRKHYDDMFQLAHYQRMLEAAGLAARDGRFGGIIGTEGVVAWHDLDEPLWRTPSSTGKTKLRSTMEVYDFEFSFRLDIMSVAQQHLDDSSTELLVVPVACSECWTCPWEEHCTEQLEDGAGDVSLLPRVGWRDWSAHRDRGVTDREALARLDYRTAQIVQAGVDPARLVGLDVDAALGDVLTATQVTKLAAIGIVSVTDIPPIDATTASYYRSGVSGLPEQIDLACAVLGPEPVYRRRGVESVDVPRADVEVDVDMENVEDGCYMWGTWTADRTGAGLVDERYRAFVTWEPLGSEAEIENFRAFWTWLIEIQRKVESKGLTFRAYCYNQGAENRYLRSQGEAAGVLDEVETFIASEAWVDLLPAFRDQLITGHGNGLKETAPIAGFEWSVDDANGDDSMVYYDLATHAKGTDTSGARAWLLSYNEGDVRATAALREWMTKSANELRAISEIS
jgi:predicted RecB family nuclease